MVEDYRRNPGFYYHGALHYTELLPSRHYI